MWPYLIPVLFFFLYRKIIPDRQDTQISHSLSTYKMLPCLLINSSRKFLIVQRKGPIQAQVTMKFIQKQNNLDIRVFCLFRYRNTVICLINQKEQNALGPRFLEIEKELLNLRHKLFFISSYHVNKDEETVSISPTKVQFHTLTEYAGRKHSYFGQTYNLLMFEV